MLVSCNSSDNLERSTMELLDTLVEMGFPRHRSAIALNMTRNAGVEPAIEWMLSHPEPEEEARPVFVAAARRLSESDGEWDDISDTPVMDSPREVHVELMCDECKLVFTNDLDIEKHTTKFGHFDYIEPPKSDSGSDISSAADQVNGLTIETELGLSDEDSSNKLSLTHQKKSKTDLRIQLPNGDVLQQTFGVNEELSYVRLFVQLNRTDGPGEFVLATIFNGRIFAEEDYSKPLHTLGLVPRAHIFVRAVSPDTSALL